MSIIATLEAQRTLIHEQIAALSPDLGWQLPGRKMPSSASGKLDALNRQLAVVNMKLKQALAR